MSEEKTIVFKEIFRSGYSIDGRFMSRPMVKKIFRNTKEQLLEKGILIPLKLGHDDKDQRLKGKILSLKLKRKLKPKLRTYEFSIFAEIEMFADAYNMYMNGELPSLSVEISPYGYDENGGEFGEHIYALALLGTDSPALPWLMHKLKDEDVAFCYSLLPNFKEYKMNPDEVLSILEEIDALTAKLRGMVEPEDGGEEEEAASEEEAAENPEASEESSFKDTPEEKQDSELPESEIRIKELEQKVKDLQAEKTFNELHAGGKIATDQKPQFKALVKETSINFAIDHYSQSKTKAPPQDKQTKSTNNPEPAKVKELTKYWNNIYTKKFNMKGDSLKKYTEMAVQKQLAKESKNGSN